MFALCERFPLDTFAATVLVSSTSDPVGLRARRIWLFSWVFSILLSPPYNQETSMGFLDKLLGRKKATEEPQTAPEPAPIPQADTGTAEPTHGEGEHSHEGEHGREQ
jgi:hypothetical protein